MTKQEYIKALMLQGEWEEDAVREADRYDDYGPSEHDIIKNAMKALQEEGEYDNETLRNQ